MTTLNLPTPVPNSFIHQLGNPGCPVAGSLSAAASPTEIAPFESVTCPYCLHGKPPKAEEVYIFQADLVSVKVSVIQEDIDSGVKRSPFRCPLHTAIVRATSPRTWVLASTEVVGIRLEGTQPGPYWYRGLPLEARNFVARFDAGLKAEPFEFDLALPQEWLEWFSKENFVWLTPRV